MTKQEVQVLKAGLSKTKTNLTGLTFAVSNQELYMQTIGCRSIMADEAVTSLRDPVDTQFDSLNFKFKERSITVEEDANQIDMINCKLNEFEIHKTAVSNKLGVIEQEVANLAKPLSLAQMNTLKEWSNLMI